MNTNVILSKDSSPSEIERYFRGVLELDQQDKVFSVFLDDVWMLAYSRKDAAVRALKVNFMENVDFIVIHQDVENSRMADLLITIISLPLAWSILLLARFAQCSRFIAGYSIM